MTEYIFEKASSRFIAFKVLRNPNSSTHRKFANSYLRMRQKRCRGTLANLNIKSWDFDTSTD